MKSWDEHFMQLAEESATRSKDPKTQVGACIVKDKRVLSLGYNGAPRKFPDELVPSNNIANDLYNSKNTYICHAELNAILNYRGCLADFKDATIYVTLFPCHECLKALVQVGISEIVYKEDYEKEVIVNISKRIAEFCNVKLRKLGDN